MLKTIATAILSIAIISSFGIYLYNLATTHVDLHLYRAWYNIELVVCYALLRIIENSWIDNFLQESIVKASFIFLYILGIDAGVTNLGYIKDPYTTLIVFIAGSLLSLIFLTFQIFINRKSYD